MRADAVRAAWRIELLGGLSATLGSTRVTRFPTEKTAALLAYIALFPRQHPRDVLVEVFWPDAEPEAARNSLSKALSSLRQRLEPPRERGAGPVIVASRATVGLDPAAFTTDAADFEAALEAARRAGSAELLERAIESYRGELLPGFYQDWVLRERDRLREGFLQAVHEAVAALRPAGRPERAIVLARRAIEADPLREQAHRDLMALEAEIGEPGAALRRYRELERVLDRELGAPPSEPTRSLAAEIERRAAPAPEVLAGTVTFLAAGPGSVSAFARASDALASALARPAGPPVAIALHTGEVAPGRGSVRGPTLERALRLLAAAPPGRILCAEATAALLKRDLEPGVRLLDLGIYRLGEGDAPDRLFEVRGPGAPPGPPALPRATPAGGAVRRLPLELSRFFGREEELARIAEALAAGRGGLLTLAGPGGIGKTRLALEAARRALDAFPGAVAFVALADLADARLIPAAIRDALGLAPDREGDPLACAVAALSRARSLLVLDGFEPLVAEGAPTVRALLERVPDLAVLATSREPLGIPGERLLRLRPLPEVPSVALLVDRVRAVRPEFELATENAGAVADLVRRLEGVPLALALAAGRLQVLSPAQLLERLAGTLDDLSTRSRGVPERHRSLRAALEWSHASLGPETERFFARLAVFRGSFDLEAAEVVTEAALALDGLSELCECSLLLAEDGPAGVRYRWLDTVREYAEEKLAAGEREDLRRRHAEHYLAAAGAAASTFCGPAQRASLERLAADELNFRAALAWSAGTDDPRGREVLLRLSHALVPLWIVRGHVAEGRRRLEEGLRRSPERTALRARALVAAGGMAIVQGDHAAARPLYEESLAIAREAGGPRELAQALQGLGVLAISRQDFTAARALLVEATAMARALGERFLLRQSLERLACAIAETGDFPSARAPFDEAAAIARDEGDERGRLYVHLNRAMAARDAGDLESARADFEEALSGLEALGDRRGAAFAILGLGSVALGEGRLGRARELLERGLAAMRELDVPVGAARALEGLGDVARGEGDLARARSLYAEGLPILLKLDQRISSAGCLERLAAVTVRAREAGRAARLLGAAASCREALGTPVSPRDRPVVEEATVAAREALGEAAFAAAVGEGRALGLERAAALALQVTA